MISWTKEIIHDDPAPSFHLASEPHIRIEVVTLGSKIKDTLFPAPHGELLVTCLLGEGIVKTEKDQIKLIPGDQVLLYEGEEFQIRPTEGHDSVRIEMIWTPGLNPCKTCWERNGRVFNLKPG